MRKPKEFCKNPKKIIKCNCYCENPRPFLAQKSFCRFRNPLYIAEDARHAEGLAAKEREGFNPDITV
jgi:hypothetical protein